MIQLNYLNGDATRPMSNTKLKIIAHICNDVGKWGKGFVLAISARWKRPEFEFRYNSEPDAELDGDLYGLGDIQLVKVEPDIYVCNMIAQHDIKPINYIPPIRYEALIECLTKLRDFINEQTCGVSVHMPKIGSGLAGGNWDIIEQIIIDELCNHDIEVNVYIKE